MIIPNKDQPKQKERKYKTFLMPNTHCLKVTVDTNTVENTGLWVFKCLNSVCVCVSVTSLYEFMISAASFKSYCEHSDVTL